MEELEETLQQLQEEKREVEGKYKKLQQKHKKILLSSRDPTTHVGTSEFKAMKDLRKRLQELLIQNQQLKDENEKLKELPKETHAPTGETTEITDMDNTLEEPPSNKKMKLDPIVEGDLHRFRKRPGTVDAGRDFEELTICLYGLKLINNDDVEDFEITSNDENCGLFDDIVIKVTFKNRQQHKYLFQLKYRERDVVIKKEDLGGSKFGKKTPFSLAKYFSSLEDASNSDCTYIIYTNNSAKLEGSLPFDEIQVENCGNFPRGEGFLLNTDMENTTFRCRSPTGKEICLFTQQYNLRQMESVVKKLLCKLLDCEIYGAVFQYIHHVRSTNYVLTKHHFISKLAELALSPFVKELSSEKSNFKAEELAKVIKKFEVTVVTNDNNIVQKIWPMEMYKDEDRASKVCALVPSDHLYKTKMLWHLNEVPLVVQVDSNNNKLVRLVLKLLRKEGRKKIVLVGQNSNFEPWNILKDERENFGGFSRWAYKRWSIFRTLKDLIETVEPPNILEHFKVSLQGRSSISLKELCAIDKEISQCFKVSDLLEMSQSKIYVIGDQITLPKFYEPRTVLYDGKEVQDKHILAACKKTVNIFYAPMGMGKSTLLQALRYYTPRESWAFYINLGTYHWMPERTEISYSKLLGFEEKSEDLAKGVQKILNKNKKVEVFLDGLDEVQAQFLEAVLRCVQEMAQQGLRVWLTSRKRLPVQTVPIETIEIQKFGFNEQQTYILKKLQEKYPVERAVNITSALFKNLNDSQEVLGVPLHLYLITEVILSNLETENFFVLSRLYDLFFKKKVCFVFEKLDAHKKDYLLRRELELYEIPALKTCLRSTDFEKLSVREELSDNFVGYLAQHGDHNGLVRSVGDNQVVFNHLSFAEYFASVWLSNHLEKVALLKDIFFSPGYKRLRFIFDNLVAENCPLHLAVIYDDLDSVERHINRCEETDKGGRTALHLACSRQTNERVLDTLLEKCTDVHKRDALFNFDYLQYSLYSGTLYPVEEMLKRNHLDTINIDMCNKKQLALKAAEFGYPKLLAAVVNQLEDKSTNLGAQLLFKGIESSVGVVETLLEFGVDLNMKYDDRTALDHACLKGGHDVVQVLLQKGAQCSNGNTVLHRVLERQTIENVEEYFKTVLDVEIDKINDKGQTALHIACEKSHLEGFKALLERSVNVNAVDNEGNNILHYAARGNNQKWDVLLQLAQIWKDKVNHKNHRGQTALHLACELSNYETVEMLLFSFEADIGVTDNDGNNVLHYAVRGDEDVRLLDLLLCKQMKASDRNRKGQTPLHLACENSHRDSVEFLIKQSDDLVDAIDIDGNTPLHYASRSLVNNEEVIDKLVQNWADVNARNNSGTTPLHLACEKGNLKNVQALLKKGADVNIVDNSGRNAFNYAENSAIEIKARLLNRGVKQLSVDDDVMDID